MNKSFEQFGAVLGRAVVFEVVAGKFDEQCARALYWLCSVKLGRRFGSSGSELP